MTTCFVFCGRLCSDIKYFKEIIFCYYTGHAAAGLADSKREKA